MAGTGFPWATRRFVVEILDLAVEALEAFGGDDLVEEGEHAAEPTQKAEIGALEEQADREQCDGIDHERLDCRSLCPLPDWWCFPGSH